ncbi:hypothetical protein GRI38_13120 [Altererythrobacter aurantiacus]|uniref:Regulatory protein RecX n=1 Tax=Parapontixanthobacter aurantiacus TaxID=1463599 RepID=A0A844ZMT9_9SPHN|nr:RecX family transcriptional regulator [Parapontixanthobacter aurantiacus]MXO86969.1 hypothetical protein [Parapontixanthobacter aurantiacus]
MPRYPNRKPRGRRPRKPLKPLDPARLEEFAVAYVARFATSAAKLEKYLLRKLRERGYTPDASENWLAEDAARASDEASLEAGRARIGELVERFVEKGYVDDDQFARSRAGSLLSRGYGARRIEQTLRHDGIAEEVRDAHAPQRAEARQAALALARKRRFGPFARGGPNGDIEDGLLPEDRDFAANEERRKLRDKQLAAMLRAGHEFADASAILDFRNEAEAEEWARGDDDA